MKKFMFTPDELTILKNFATIQPTMVISPHGFYVRNSAENMVGIHRFQTPYEFERFGIYEVPELISILGVYKTPEISVHEKYLEISDNSKVKYFTTPVELSKYLQNVGGEIIDPYNQETGRYRIEDKFQQVSCELEFTLTQEHLTMLMKMASLLKSNNKYVFFESFPDRVKITVGEKLESSFNSWELDIKEGIVSNALPEPRCMKVADLKVICTDYNVKLSSKGISLWKSDLVDYYIGVANIKH